MSMMAQTPPPPTQQQAVQPTVEPPERLPVFSTREVRFRKAEGANTLLFSVPTHSSLLLQLLSPKCHGYEERDHRWLHLLQAVALVPSRKTEKLCSTVRQALKLPMTARAKRDLETLVDPLVLELEQTEESATAAVSAPTDRALLGLKLKDKVAEFLRAWIADPIEGFVLRKEHVVGGMRLDDLVATPLGAGYLRGFRRDDGFCVVVFPWGHGFIRLCDVDQADQALAKQLKKKRKFNEFVALEHQQLFEQVGGLLQNYPSPSSDQGDREGVVVEVGAAEYKKLVESLEEEHADASVLERDLGFVRRVQALVVKTKERHHAQASSSDEPQLKQQRLDDDDVDDDVDDDIDDDNDNDENGPRKAMEEASEQPEASEQQEPGGQEAGA